MEHLRMFESVVMKPGPWTTAQIYRIPMLVSRRECGSHLTSEKFLGGIRELYIESELF